MTESPYLAGPIGPVGEVADALQDTCLVCDPYVYGRARFLAEPLYLTEGFRDGIYRASADVGALFESLSRLLLDEPELYEAFYTPTPYQRAMWLVSGGAWHVFARLDVFWCNGAFQVCEINADTPSGQSDIVACSSVFASRGAYADGADPNADYERLFMQSVDAVFRSQVADRPYGRVGIVYPTDLPEDMALVQLYGDWFRAAGCDVILGSPYNVTKRPDGGVAVFGMPVDVILRHYKTDWWGEREPGRDDDAPYLDPDPLEQAVWLLEAERAGRVAIVNPFGAIVPQDKRSMAFFWEHIDRFTPSEQATIRAHIPETYVLETIGADRLLRERTEWVLKSDFGCEAEEVFVGRDLIDADWHDAVTHAYPRRWVAQRAFEATPIGESDAVDAPVANFGVYLVGGTPAGLYVRLAPANEPTGHGAVVATPVVIAS